MENYNDELLAKALEECAQEPIQYPEAIQEHGILFVINENYEILRASNNTQHFLELPAKEFLNQKLHQFFELPEDFGQYYNPMFENAYSKTENMYFQTLSQYELIFIPQKKYFIATLTRVETNFILELECKPKEKEKLNPFVISKEILLDVNQYKEDLSHMLEDAIQKIQLLTGFGRVMVYKFAPDWSGEVITEVKIESMPSYLGLHFPASDIPEQARVLYTKNWIRVIPDVYYQAVPIISNEMTPTKPIDLSHVSLRSVSPVHIQYLKNMKINATIAISLIINNKLWGLIVGHHPEPRSISVDKRNICEFIGQVLSLQINAYEKHKADLKRERTQTGLEIITSKLFENTNLFQELQDLSQRLIELVNAHSFWIVWGQEEFLTEDIPEDAQERQKLLNFLKTYFKNHDTPYFSHQIGEFINLSPDFLKKVGGVLAVSISIQQNLYLIWFKKEKISTVSWVGSQEKNLVFKDNRARLLPRNSFDVWKETVKGESAAWLVQDLEAVTALKASILANLLLNTEKLREEKKKLEQEVQKQTQDLQLAKEELEELVNSLKESNDELKNFAYVTSHDLQEPLRQISTFTQLMERKISDKLNDKEHKYLDFIVSGTKNMQSLIDDLLQYTRLSGREHQATKVDLNKVIQKVLLVLSATIEESQAEIQVQNLPIIQAKELLMTQLFQNLLSNAIKYQRKGSIPKISITYEEQATHWQFVVKDNGIGIEEEFYETIFQVFRRLHTKMEYLGNGMGLTLCKKIVNQHQGEIWLESELGKGSSFYFTISKNLPIKVA